MLRVTNLAGQVCNFAVSDAPGLFCRRAFAKPAAHSIVRPVYPTRRSFRFARICLPLAWLLAAGFHLDALQLYAWTTMAIRFARNESVGDAIVTTLKPESMCRLCHAVKRARDRQQQSPVLPQNDTKPVIVFLALPVVVLPEPPGRRLDAAAVHGTGIERARPPLPPPRGSACV
jgi:hypothetical protein